jgi:hypothetical protein
MITVLKDLGEIRRDRSILNTISLITGDGHTFFAFHCQSNTTIVRENIITHVFRLLPSSREKKTRRSTIKSEDGLRLDILWAFFEKGNDQINRHRRNAEKQQVRRRRRQEEEKSNKMIQDTKDNIALLVEEIQIKREECNYRF